MTASRSASALPTVRVTGKRCTLVAPPRRSVTTPTSRSVTTRPPDSSFADAGEATTMSRGRASEFMWSQWAPNKGPLGVNNTPVGVNRSRNAFPIIVQFSYL